MRDYPELLILRHGETEWNRQGRMQGSLDSPLTETGRLQARQQNAVLQAFGVEGFGWHVSPLGRAMQTAEIAGQGLTNSFSADDRLREIEMGDWTGRLRQEIEEIAPQHFAPNAPPLGWYGYAPGGETLQMLEARVAAFLGTLTAPAVVVTHGITSRVMRCLALGLPVEAFAHLEGGQGIAYRVAHGVYEKRAIDGVTPQECPAS